MHLFETMKLDKGFIPRLDYHYQRISTSSEHLGFKFDHLFWKQFIHNIKTLHSKGVFRLKVTLNKEGELNYELFPIPDKPFFTARLVQQKKNIDKVIITNKTTERDYLTHNHFTDLILIYDEDGKILEFDIGNVMIQERDKLYTPTYKGDMLPGCMRQSLIDQGKVIEKDFYIEEFRGKIKSSQINVYLINSLREVVGVKVYV